MKTTTDTPDKKFSFQLPRNFSVFFICLSFAFLFWLLKLFSNTYTTVIDLPVKYSGFPQDKAILNNIPRSLAVKVDARGYDLLAFSINSKNDSLLIDGEYLQQKNSGDKTYHYIETKPLLRNASIAVSSGIIISELLTDTLKFYFDDKITKVVPVKLNLETDFEKQHLMKGEISVFPEAIKITGPASIVDTIRFAGNKKLIFNKLNRDMTSTVKIAIYDKRLEVAPKNVLITIPVEKFTESTISLPIEFINKSADYSVKTFPAQIEITYLVGLSNYDLVKKNKFRAVVDLEQLKKEPSGLQVKVTKSPDFIKITRQSPTMVEYIIKK